MLFKCLTTIVCFLCTGIYSKDSPIVKLPEGYIQGLEHETFRNHVKYFAYMGIPYAAPPVGKLRFEPPQIHKNWSGILQTKSLTKMCHQTGAVSKYETEDCLYLNVFTPAVPGSNSSLPVMVDIHGGAFLRGSATSGFRKPQFIIETGVVVVNFNYRLGPFGFLSTLDHVIPGNMGLKDQLMVLKWVNMNIHLFGGDPKKVTLMGQSAGAASVTYHILSPKSSGLFRAAIANSASALCSWANQRHAVSTAYAIANAADKSFSNNRSSNELKRLLQGIDANFISKAGNHYKSFAPVVEVNYDGAFITDSMYESADSGSINRVPLLIGHTSEESLAKAANMENIQMYAKIFDRDPRLLVDEDMGITNVTISEHVGRKIKSIYVNSSHFELHLEKIVQYMSDNSYIRAVQKFAELLSQYTDVYFYVFSYHGSLGNNKVSLPEIGKVCHAEDMRYLWTYIDTLDGINQADIATVDRYVGLLTNFAKYLNPTPITDGEDLLNIYWPKMSKKSFTYLDIDSNLTIRYDPREFSYRKWVDLYETYVKKPYISF